MSSASTHLRWQGRRDVSGFITPTGRRFYRAALLRLADLDVPRLVTIRLDGRAIAFALSLQLSSRGYGLTTAFDPEFARVSPGWEAILHRLETAAGEGVTRFEFLGAAMPHKQRLTDRLEPDLPGHRPATDAARSRRRCGPHRRDPLPPRDQALGDREKALLPRARPRRAYGLMVSL